MYYFYVLHEIKVYSYLSLWVTKSLQWLFDLHRAPADERLCGATIESADHVKLLCDVQESVINMCDTFAHISDIVTLQEAMPI